MAATRSLRAVEGGRFIADQDRRRYVHGRLFLRDVLADALLVDPSDVVIAVGPTGKPRLVPPSCLPPTDLRFNVSHSGDFYAVILSDGLEVGIDVEHVRDDIEWRDLAARYFAPAEVADLAALPPDDQRLGFYRVWTRKEAYLKPSASASTVPLDGFRVSVGEPARLLSTDHDPSQFGRWSLESLDVPPGYVGARASKTLLQALLNPPSWRPQ
ncbi:MAG: 4'-phosphopantetheinyl transferase superfamily protein [Gemmataceae bacterium]